MQLAGNNHKGNLILFVINFDFTSQMIMSRHHSFTNLAVL